MPVTLSMSPPTFSMPRMPFLNRMRCTGSQSGKSSFQSRPPDHFLVFGGEMRMQRPVALRTDRSRQRMIVGLGIVADDFHFLFHEPFAGRRHEAGRVTEIVFAILVLLVPAGVDDHHVARPHHLAGGLFEIVVGDRLPFLFRDRHDDAGAEKMRQRHFVDKRRALNDMRRRVDMRGVVHRRGDALRQHARLRHVMNAFDLDVFEVRPVRRLIAEAMGQIVERQSHRVVLVLLERDPAYFLHHSILPVRAPLGCRL